MNPAALKADLGTRSARAAPLILNEDAFTQRNIDKAGYESDPTADGTLDGYSVYRVPMTSITLRATETLGVSKKEAERSKNMFALGLVSWMYGRPTDVTINWLESKFGGKQEIFEANVAAFNAGYNFGETTELFAHQVQVKAAPVEPGRLSQRRGRPGDGVGADRGVGTRAGCRCSTPATRSRRRPSCCTSCRSTRTSVSSRSRRRTRSPRPTSRSVRRSPGSSP